MNKILIVEDDAVQCHSIREIILQTYPEWDVKCASDYNEAVSLIDRSLERNDYFTLFLLDIQLSKKNDAPDGFSLANKIRNIKEYYRTPLLFLTSVVDKTNYALSNFHCYNYITKPYSDDDILEQINQMMLSGYLINNSLTFRDINHVLYNIVSDDIICVELRSHYVIITTAYGEISTRDYNYSMLCSLLPDNFVTCHRKFIINVNHVTWFDENNRIVKVADKSINVSRTYKNELENKLKKVHL